MSDRLEASSKVFKTPICISHWLVGLLSPQAKKLLRIVDRITVPGLFKEQNSQDLTNNAVKEHIPMTIYTFDVTDPVMKFLEPKFDPVHREDKRRHNQHRGQMTAATGTNTAPNSLLCIS